MARVQSFGTILSRFRKRLAVRQKAVGRCPLYAAGIGLHYSLDALRLVYGRPVILRALPLRLSGRVFH